MKKYRENMDASEYAEMLKEILALDDAYAVAAKMDAEFDKQFTCTCDAGGSAGCPVHDEAVDEMAELRKAALNHKGGP